VHHPQALLLAVFGYSTATLHAVTKMRRHICEISASSFIAT